MQNIAIVAQQTVLLNYAENQMEKAFWTGNACPIISFTRLRSGQFGVQFPAAARGFSFLKHVPAGSVAHPVYSSMGTGILSSEIKLAQHEADHLPPSNVEIKN